MPGTGQLTNKDIVPRLNSATPRKTLPASSVHVRKEILNIPASVVSCRIAQVDVFVYVFCRRSSSHRRRAT